MNFGNLFYVYTYLYTTDNYKDINSSNNSSFTGFYIK